MSELKELLERVEKLEQRFDSLVTNHSRITNDYKSYSLEHISSMWDEINAFRNELNQGLGKNKNEQ